MGTPCRIYTDPEAAVLIFPDGGLGLPEITHRIAEKISVQQQRRLSESALWFIRNLADVRGADGVVSYRHPGILIVGVHRDADPTDVAVLVLELLGLTSGCDFEILG